MSMGRDFVEVIRGYVEANGIDVPAGPVPLFRGEGPQSGPSRDGVLSNTYERTREMVEEGMTLDEIAERRGLARNTIISHLERIVAVGIDMDLKHLAVSPERLVIIAEAFLESGSISLSPVKERLGDDFEYEELKLVRVILLQEDKSSKASRKPHGGGGGETSTLEERIETNMKRFLSHVRGSDVAVTSRGPTQESSLQGQRETMGQAGEEYPRAYQIWEEVEDQELTMLFNSGMRVVEIASTFERRPSAIRSRLRHLGIIE